MQKNLTKLPIDSQIRQDDLFRGVVVPFIAGIFLIVPDVFARIRPESDDRRRQQIILSSSIPDSPRPGIGVSRADVQQIELRVVSHRVPDGASPAVLPPLAAPCFCRFFQERAFERLRRITWYSIEAPNEISRLRIISGNVPTDAHFRTAVPDDHLTFHHARRTGNRVTHLWIDRQSFPNRFTGGGVESDQSSIQCPHKYLPPPPSHASIHNITTRVHRPFGGNFRIVLPAPHAGRGVEGNNFAPGGGEIHHAVNDEWRGFLAAARVQTVIPRQRHLIDILVVDCFQRAEALFIVRAAMAQPIFRLLVVLDDAGAVHVCRLCGRRALRLLRRVGTGYAEARRQRENQHHRDSGTSVLSHRFSLQQPGFGCAAGQRHGGGGGRTPVPPARSAYLSPCLFPVKRQFLIPAFRRRESQWRRNGAVHARSNSRRYSASLPIIALTII